MTNFFSVIAKRFRSLTEEKPRMKSVATDRN